MAPLNLFSTIGWHDFEQLTIERMRKEISNLATQNVLGSSMDDLCQYYVDRYTIEVPILIKANIEIDQEEVQVDISNDPRRGSMPGRGPYIIPGTEVNVFIPFSGSSELFKVTPSRYGFNRPKAVVKNEMLKLTFTEIKHDESFLKSSIDQQIHQIEEYLDRLKQNVAEYNPKVRQYANDWLSTRKQKLLNDQKLVSSLGFNLRKREGTPQSYNPPEIKRKIQPRIPPQSTTPFKPEPELLNKDYEHILTVLDNMTRVMEQNPSAFTSMGEETLRTHFLEPFK